MMMRHVIEKPLALLALTGLLVMVTGCGGSSRPNIDLDEILNITGKTLQEPIPESLESGISRDLSAASGTTGSSRTIAMSEAQTSTALTGAFLDQLAKNFNAGKLHTDPLGVRFEADGGIVGFTDQNKDMTRNGSDKDVFKIQIDADRQRLVATDLEDPAIHRDHSYRGYHSWGHGYWGYHTLGSMRGSQDRYFNSRRTARPNFSSMSMAPSGYAKPGSSYRSPSARSMGGSRSFSGGK